MTKNHYDNIDERLPKFTLKNMRALINIYINNRTFFIKSTIYSKILNLFYSSKKIYYFRFPVGLHSRHDQHHNSQPASP